MPRTKKSQNDADLEAELQPVMQARKQWLTMQPYLRLSEADRVVWHQYRIYIQAAEPLIYQFRSFARTEFYADFFGLPEARRPAPAGKNKRRAVQPAPVISD
jgi:hypothetical protein